MKNLILIFALIICSQLYGQKFTITPNGLRDSDNIENTYVVIKFDGFTTQQLFDNAKRYIIQNYKNPDFVKKGAIDNEYLNFVTYTPYIATVNGGIVKIKYDAKYRTELYFKDGKVRFEVIELEMKAEGGAHLNFVPKGALGGWYIFNGKGKLKQEGAKQEIEDYFNDQIIKLTNYLNGKTKINDDW